MGDQDGVQFHEGYQSPVAVLGAFPVCLQPLRDGGVGKYQCI